MATLSSLNNGDIEIIRALLEKNTSACLVQDLNLCTDWLKLMDLVNYCLIIKDSYISYYISFILSNCLNMSHFMWLATNHQNVQ